jgi:hypothetical protein
MIEMHFPGNYPTHREQALCQTGASIQLIEILIVTEARAIAARRENGQELPIGKNLLRPGVARPA